jgi:hypothetical protein
VVTTAPARAMLRTCLARTTSPLMVCGGTWVSRVRAVLVERCSVKRAPVEPAQVDTVEPRTMSSVGITVGACGRGVPSKCAISNWAEVAPI